MARHRTPEEMLKSYVVRMGDPLGSVYYDLWQQVVWLNVKWSEYVEMFGTKPSRVELLNNAAPRFFRIVQDTLFEETLLHIARLTDPAESRVKKDIKKNATIQALPPLVEPAIKGKVTTLVDASLDASEFCRDWRNRRIAHRDLELALKTGATPLLPASREKVKHVIASLGDVLNAVNAHYFESETAFDFIDSGDGAVSLLYVIDDGLKLDA